MNATEDRAMTRLSRFFFLLLCASAVPGSISLSAEKDASFALVLDCASSSGQVVVARNEGGKWSSSVLVERVTAFRVASSGWYLYRMQDNGWRRGRIGSKVPDEKVSSQALNTAGKHAEL